MDENDWLAQRFEEHRTHLRAVAYRMLGSASEADDAVQEAWLRLGRSDVDAVQNLGGWLTTVVGRVCLDMLRSRASRREDPLDTDAGTGVRTGVGVGAAGVGGPAVDPEQEAVLTDSVGVALLVVLEALAPAERLAFVLHDMFGVPFDEIAPVVGRSPAGARQLASRARRRVQGAAPATGVDPVRRREIVDAFLAASRGGDFEALLAVLDPEVVIRADDAAVAAGSERELRGAAAVAGFFTSRARGAQRALLDGLAAAVWAPGGKPRVVFGFTITDGRISGIDLIADPERLPRLDLVVLDL